MTRAARARRSVAWLSVADGEVRERISGVLRRTGYAVIDVGDCAAMIEALREAGERHDALRPALAVIDLPHADDALDGVIGALRRAEPHLPIVVVLGPDGLEGSPRLVRRDTNVLFVRRGELDVMHTAAVVARP